MGVVGLTVQHLNRRMTTDGLQELQVGARILNEGIAIEGCKTKCSINLTVEGPADALPQIDLGSVMFLDLEG